MSKLTEKSEIDVLADADLLYVRDFSDPSNPDKKVPYSKVRPNGARITNHLAYSGSVTVPTLAAGANGDATITVAGAQLGDHVAFNATLPSDIAVMGCWVSAANTVKVRFRNVDDSSSFPTAAIACRVLVSRSTP